MASCCARDRRRAEPSPAPGYRGRPEEDGVSDRCPRCSTPTTPSQRFCGACGSSLERGCPRCGAGNPPGFRFCGSCGASLEEQPVAPPSPEGAEERRWATVVFADLSGFTSLSERSDPEDVRD